MIHEVKTLIVFDWVEMKTIYQGYIDKVDLDLDYSLKDLIAI